MVITSIMNCVFPFIRISVVGDGCTDSGMFEESVQEEEDLGLGRKFSPLKNIRHSQLIKLTMELLKYF